MLLYVFEAKQKIIMVNYISLKVECIEMNRLRNIFLFNVYS